MSRELTAFRLPPEQLAALRAIKDRDGVPLTQQVQRALALWIKSKGIETKTARKRVAPRRQA
jgi:hypothetical protein